MGRWTPTHCICVPREEDLPPHLTPDLRGRGGLLRSRKPKTTGFSMRQKVQY